VPAALRRSHSQTPFSSADSGLLMTVLRGHTTPRKPQRRRVTFAEARLLLLFCVRVV
jgi:hypothetical protein